MKAAEFERIIIKALYVNKEVRSKVLPYLDNKWFFDVDNKIIVDKILKFTSSFNTMPTVIETKRMIDDDQTCGVFDLIMAIKDEDVMTEYILSEIEEFVKRKLIYRACEGGMKYVTTGEKINGSIADEMAEAEAFTFNAKEFPQAEIIDMR